jgi:hypothetical protein
VVHQASLASLLLGLVLANLLRPGDNLNLPLPDAGASANLRVASLSLKDFVAHLVPRSAIEVMVQSQILQIVVFSLFFGVACASDDVLLYGFIAAAPGGSGFRVAGDYLSYAPYGLMYLRDDPPFAAVVERTFARTAERRRLCDLYTRWFLRRPPNGERLNLPMRPQLENGEPE